MKNCLLFLYIIVLSLLSISCKKSETLLTSSKNKNIEAHDILVSKQDDNALLNFVTSTSFDFKGYSLENIRAYIDNITNNIAQIKIYIENSGGTGTLGWMKVDFFSDKVYDITIDPENPKELKFNKEKYIIFKNEILGYESPDMVINDTTKSHKLPIEWSSENNLLSVKLSDTFFNLKIDNPNNDYFVTYLPKTEIFIPIILSSCDASGYCEEYLIIIKDNKEYSKLKIYYNTAADGNLNSYETRVYKISEDFFVDLKTEKYVKDKLISEKRQKYKINTEGKIILQ
ncbi:hypothetical protein [Chryseobacterium jejuense]|uniref:hypothetical protein n=1 Tax=Chryseobacterium jejuense TaxID=445960 RepID=UPI001AEABDD5|nr:hypothetical protein [Chryseobacterium jejuense]MBP2615257.1 hypothetical protein [Chryseobacterium jejuense]